MNTYTATIKSLFGGCTRVSIQAYSIQDARTIADAQYGDKLLYVEI